MSSDERDFGWTAIGALAAVIVARFLPLATHWLHTPKAVPLLAPRRPAPRVGSTDSDGDTAPGGAPSE